MINCKKGEIVNKILNPQEFEGRNCTIEDYTNLYEAYEASQQLISEYAKALFKAGSLIGKQSEDILQLRISLEEEANSLQRTCDALQKDLQKVATSRLARENEGE
jgi:hypothetical protein